MSSWHVDCFEVNVVNKDEQTMTLLLTATPCVSLTGKTSGAICIGQDITKLKDLDERKASMMAMVSHELKSPLHGIIGLCSSLMSESSNSERLPKAVETMHNCASRLLDMVANIMDAPPVLHRCLKVVPSRGSCGCQNKTLERECCAQVGSGEQQADADDERSGTNEGHNRRGSISLPERNSWP